MNLYCRPLASIENASKPTTTRSARRSAVRSFEFPMLLFIGVLCLTFPLLGQAGKPGKPVAPSTLTAAAASSSQINLAWKDNSLNETGFVIQRGTSSSGPWSQVATTGANITNYANATGLNAASTYWYRVCAYGSRGSSRDTPPASATTQPVIIACTYTPSAPSTPVAAGGTSGTVGVTAGTGCAWSATPGYTWIHTTSTGSGSGTVSYTVDANSSTSSRTGTIAVQNQTFTIKQAGAACTYALSPAS